MLQQAADVVHRHLAQVRVAVPVEQRLAALPEALVHVHAGPVVAEERLRHEGHGASVLDARYS